MSYFFTSKSHLLSHQTENISLAAIISLTHFISTGKQYLSAMFIKLNKIILYVNFNKHKLNYVICNIKDLLINREYIVIPIIPIVEVIKN